jgi:urea transport system ATP-binding protein
LVEQKLPFVRRIADHFIIFDKGRLVAKGEIAELDDELAQKYLTV